MSEIVDRKARPSWFGLAAAACAVILLSGCSSITQGTTQEIFINSVPAGASCVVDRNGVRLGEVASTPSSVRVDKSKHDIIITCNKEGYQEATFYNDSGWESGSGAAGIALDVILTAGLSSAIDSATGADNKYTSPVNITLVPK